MSWEAIGAIAAVLSVLLSFWGGYALHRRKDQVQVSGHVITKEQQDLITADRLSLVLAGFAANEKVTQIKADLEGRIDDMDDQLGNKIEQRFNDLDKKRSDDIRGLHEKVGKTREELARLAERTETQTAMLSNIDAKLTNLMRREK